VSAEHEPACPTPNVQKSATAQPEVRKKVQKQSGPQSKKTPRKSPKTPQTQHPLLVPNKTFKGIVNLGSSCYASTVLQLFFNIPELQPLLTSGQPVSLCLICTSFLQMFRVMPINLCSLYYSSSMRKTLLTTRQAQWLRNTVYATITNNFLCSACGHEFSNHESVNYVSCPVQTDNITSITLEPVIDDSGHPCANCQNSTKCSTVITHAPPVLLVLLLRFDRRLRKYLEE
jgi:uncharacterized UBP type Zn finger protein